MTTKKTTKRPVVITTAHRGVFVGTLESQPAPGEVVLSHARMIVYWSADMRGVVGLATRPVTEACRVSDAVDRIALSGVTAVLDATPEAAASWETAPWG